MQIVTVPCLVATGVLASGQTARWQQPILTGKPDDDVMLAAIKGQMLQKLQVAVFNEPLQDITFEWTTTNVTIDDG